MVADRQRPISIAMMALGGQGGGVLTGWLVDIAESNGYLAQSTYVAGVAQRTGATVYCVELFPQRTAEKAGQLPIFTPYPVPGDVDLVIAGEMAETGRAIQKGFVTPNLTTLIASSHRVYAMSEKEALGDGIIDLSIVADVAAKAARRFICFDMQRAADETGSVISSVLLGAIAASGALPFGRQAFEASIRRTGKSVEANLRGFAAGYDGAADAPDDSATAPAPEAVPAGPNGEALAARISSELPAAVRDIALHGALRLADYQDIRYANDYLDRLGDFATLDDAGRGFVLTTEVARQLALQMAYEDTIRVADLKTRRDRFVGIRAQAAASDDQPIRVVEYFHPRIEELCDTLPAALGARLLASPRGQRLLAPLFRKGRNIATSSISGFLFLHMVAKLKRFRRGTYRYCRQALFIDDWLGRTAAAAAADYDFGVAIARCVEMVRGYGDTYERGLSRYRAIVDAAGRSGTAEVVERLHRAALADEKGDVFRQALHALDTRP